jgi:metal-dependent amidase/aminoacylase/carboxypeptidase family protein
MVHLGYPREVVFNAEYDALPGKGHACGHNLILTSSVWTFIRCFLDLKASGKPGEVHLLGTPAEESGGDKLRLIKEGAYNQVDACLMAHPGPRIKDRPDLLGVSFTKSLASRRISVNFHGEGLHAGRSEPGEGAVNAFVFSQLLVLECYKELRRKYGPSIIVNQIVRQGGESANTVPSIVAAQYSVRAATGALLDIVCEGIAARFAQGAQHAKCIAREPTCRESECVGTGCKPSHFR